MWGRDSEIHQAWYFNTDSLVQGYMCCSSGQAAPKCAKVAYWLFWIKIKGEPAGTKRTLWPSFVPMRAGNKAPVGRCPTFGYGWRASLLTERGDSRSRKLSEQTVTSSFISYPKEDLLVSTNVHNYLILHLKGISTSWCNHFLAPLCTGPPHLYKLNLFFSL